MRRLLKAYVVALPCFLVAGTWLASVLYGGFFAPMPADDSLLVLPSRFVLALVGATIYGPFAVVANAGTMTVAATTFVACVAIVGRWTLGAGAAVASALLAAATAAVAASLPELRLTPSTAWRELAFSGNAAGAFGAGLFTAFLLRILSARAAVAKAADAPNPPGASRARTALPVVLALAIALLAFAWRASVSEERSDEVLLQREAKAAADRFAAASPEAQAALAGELMAKPGIRASISEWLPGGHNPTSRPIRDRAQLEAEIAAIRARVGPPRNTTRAEFYDRDLKGDRTGYSVHFRHHYDGAEIGEALYYRLDGTAAALVTYNLLTNGGGEITRFVGLLVSR